MDGRTDRQHTVFVFALSEKTFTDSDLCDMTAVHNERIPYMSVSLVLVHSFFLFFIFLTLDLVLLFSIELARSLSVKVFMRY